MNCPYRVEETRLRSGEWGCMLFGGIGMGMVPVMAILMGEAIPFWIFVVLMPFLLGGLSMIGGGLYLLFGRQQTIFNPANGQTWQQTRMFGLPVVQTATSVVEEITWTGAPARILRYPASVAERYRDGKDAEIFSAALLQLMAQGVVALGQVKVFRRFRKPTRLYVLMPAEHDSQVEILGELEKRIAVVAQQAGTESIYFEYLGNRYTRTHRGVLCMEDVIRMVFEVGDKNREAILLRSLVGEEAEALGLGVMEGNQIKKFSPGKNTLGKVSLDFRSVDQLHRDFWMTEPDHARDLLAQVELMILSIVSHKRKTAS